MNDDFRAAGLAYAAAIAARLRDEPDEVLIDLGSGILWRMDRYDYERMHGRQRARTYRYGRRYLPTGASR